ncbi:hypothetical protein EV127DRAFT_38608 [Xylaria flabelliformis]|nr:hypothetical protein EV127DRAFT_38608 [Xylaria flabelliformis]
MMNTKLSTVIVVGGTPTEKPRRRPWGFSQALRLTAFLALILVVVYNVFQFSPLRQRLTWPSPSTEKTTPALELHIISKCPNAMHALTELVLPTIERVHDKVDFKLSIIAREISEDGSVQCLHGPSECEGSTFELCTQEQLYPDSETLVGFVECLTADYHQIPAREHYEACASNHTVDLAPIDRCMARDGGAYGHNLLVESVQHSKDVSVRISGTIRLNEQIYCIRDGPNWTNCPNGPGVDELVDAIEKLHDAATWEL